MPLLDIQDLCARYGDAHALEGVSLSLDVGETLALAGANGAGKTTLMRCLCGLMPPASGEIRIDDQPLAPADPRSAARAGLALVPEGRLLFESLSVEENLRIAASERPGHWTLDTIYALFPVLKDKRALAPSALSGGQQQMVAIGRALASNPRILLCDEISLGLSPLVTGEVYDALRRVQREGVAMIVVDQDVARAQAVSDRVACMFQGQLTLVGPAGTTTAADLKTAFFGGGA